MSANPPMGEPPMQAQAAAPPQPHYAQLHPSFQHQQFVIRRDFFAFLGARVRVFSPAGELVQFCKMKAFKLKEDLTIFADAEKTEPLVRIRARNIIDLAAVYDVFDVTSGQEYHLGSLKRRGLKSMLRDEWEIWNTSDQPIGRIQEESGTLAAIRRFIDFAKFFLPQEYNFTVHNYPVGRLKQTFNPFIMKMNANFTQDTQGYLDRRLAMAAANLLCTIEGKQG